MLLFDLFQHVNFRLYPWEYFLQLFRIFLKMKRLSLWTHVNFHLAMMIAKYFHLYLFQTLIKILYFLLNINYFYLSKINFIKLYKIKYLCHTKYIYYKFFNLYF